MASDIHSREQRLRKQAELQSLYNNLASLREHEASYVAASAALPELLLNQINEQRQQIKQLENELLDLDDSSIQTPARQFYWEAFEAEQADDLEKASKLYKNAARANYADAEAAQHSVRYRIKLSKSKSSIAGQMWAGSPALTSRRGLWIGLAAILVLALLSIIVLNTNFSSPSQNAGTVQPTPTPTPTPPSVILIIPDTPTLTPTSVPADTPTFTPPPPSTPPVETVTTTPSPSPKPTLRPAPQILEPKDGLVWIDGAIVFEFKKLDLAYDEIYCLNTLRGYDRTLTENWSFPPVGNRSPAIPIEADVFRIAKSQGMECIVWSAAIGKVSCDDLISENTEERVVGLPRPCEFEK